MHKLDEISQKERPTVMAPRYGELDPCTMRKTRFLMGRDGLYIDTQQPWGRLIKLLWQAPRPLPYGDVTEVDEFWPVLADCFENIIKPQMFPDAAKYARSNKEWGGCIFFDGNLLAGNPFYYQRIDFDADVDTLDYRRKIPRGSALVVDVHSHGEIDTFFSSKDNFDDKGGVRICVVLGNYKSKGESHEFQWKARYIVEGFFFNLEGDNEALPA